MLLHLEERGRSQSRSTLSQPHPGTPTLYRSFSERPASAKTVIPQDGRNSDTLRLAVLRNEHRRGSSRTTIDMGRSNVHTNPPNKNIPMLSDNHRWNLFAMPKAQEKSAAEVHSEKPTIADSKQSIKWSVSPLTKIERAQIDRNSSQIVAKSPINSVESTDNRFEDLNRINKSSRSTDVFQDLRHKMKVNNNVSKPFDEMSNVSSSESEEEAPVRDASDGSPSRLSLSDGEAPKDIEAPSSVLDFMKELADALPKTNMQAVLPIKTYSTFTRTQQKMLDLKDLMREESQDTISSPFANLLDYATKIQNEALLAEWGQIRQRFSSYVSPLSQKNITCQAGVLGSIKRCQEYGYGAESTQLVVTEEEKNLFLKKMWFGEFVQVKEATPEPTAPEPVNSPSNYSLMAQSVMASRRPPDFGT